LIYSIVFLDALLMFAIVPLLPSYARDLGLSTTQAGLVVAVYSGTVLIAGLPAGRAADRFGARQVTIVGIALLALSTGAYGFAHTFPALLAARMGQGVSSAISWSAGLAWLSEATPTERRPAALGTAMAAGSTGALVGPVVGGPLGEHLGIRAPFVIFAVVAAALTVWAFFEPGARGRAEVVVGVRDLPRLAARNELIAATLLITLIVAVVSGVTETLVPLHLGARGYSPGEISIVLGIAGVLGVLANVTCGRIYNRFGGIRIARTALIGAAIGTLGLAAAEQTTVVSLVYIIVTPTIAFQYAVAFPLAAEGAQRERVPQGVILGAINVCWGLGFMIGPAAGAAIAQALSQSVSYVLATVVSLVGFAALRSLALSRRECQEPA
jgi:DHA1 family multidrug resistance protein-like MFS transporter